MTFSIDTVRNDRPRIFEQLKEIVSFNSVGSDPALAGECTAAAEWVQKAFAEAGVELEAIKTVDGSLTLIGERTGEEGAPTVLLYSHYDVVPAGNLDAWTNSPFELTERDGRWYGRGAADCKGNLVMHLAALRALEQLGGTAATIKVLIEGTEECGGEGLSTLIKERPELFAADAILIADAGNVAVGQPTLTTALRGGAQIKVTMRTLEAGVHSGQFGGAAPDAVKALMRALDSLTDEHGRTVIDGVDCAGTWPGLGYDREAFRGDALLLEGSEILGEDGDEIADFLWARPALTVTGFSSTPVDKAVNAIPPVASANLNLRVPAHMDPAEVAVKVEEHIRAHTPWGAQVEVEIRDANRGFTADPTKPAAQLLSQCLAEAYGKETVQMGMGGSIPLTVELQEAHPDAEIALFGVEEPKATIHSPNESVDPSEIEHIAMTEALFLSRFGK